MLDHSHPHSPTFYILLVLSTCNQKWLSPKCCDVILTSFWRHPMWNTCTRTHLLYQGAIQSPWGTNSRPREQTVIIRAKPSPWGQNRHPQSFFHRIALRHLPICTPEFILFFIVYFSVLVDFTTMYDVVMSLWRHSNVRHLENTHVRVKIHVLDYFPLHTPTFYILLVSPTCIQVDMSLWSRDVTQTSAILENTCIRLLPTTLSPF